jgi:hypothetical protein
VISRLAFFFLLFLFNGPLSAAQRFPLTTPDGLDSHNVVVESSRHRGRRGIRVVETAGAAASSTPAVAVIEETDFENGTIEVDVAGERTPGASEGARGFIGVAFRISDDLSRFENFYIRPTNGRSTDQLRRNHSTQYASYPDYPWHRLRKDSPGVYESYADLETGAWTHLKIVVRGSYAELYVNRAPQPALIVNDLKNPPGRGRVGLWIGAETVGHFANLVITEANEVKK